MSSYKDCIDELVQDFISSFDGEWTAEDCDLVERVINEETERFQDGYRELTEVDADHFDKQQLDDFWDEVIAEVQIALKAHSLI